MMTLDEVIDGLDKIKRDNGKPTDEELERRNKVIENAIAFLEFLRAGGRGRSK